MNVRHLWTNALYIYHYMFNKWVAYCIKKKVLTLYPRPFITCLYPRLYPNKNDFLLFHRTNPQIPRPVPTSHLPSGNSLLMFTAKSFHVMILPPPTAWLPYHLSKSVHLSRRVPSPVPDNTFLDHIRLTVTTNTPSSQSPNSSGS